MQCYSFVSQRCDVAHAPCGLHVFRKAFNEKNRCLGDDTFGYVFGGELSF